MNIQKERIADLPLVYAAADLTLQGKRFLAAASEKRNEKAYLIDPKTRECNRLWEGDSGVMNVIQIPGREALLAIVRFYPVFQSKEAAVVLLTPGPGGVMSPWKVQEVFSLPFCHRIGIVENQYGQFVLACQLCADKEFEEDWSKPGAVWMAPIPKKSDGEWKLYKLYDGLIKNHGLWIGENNQAFICAENGILHFDLSSYHAGETVLPNFVSTAPASDLFLVKSRGQAYAGVIEPFHGDSAVVYRISASGWERIRQFPIQFGHVIWIGELFGKLSLIVGSRGGEKQLEAIDLDTGERTVLESGVGPAQISVYQEGDTVRIFAANHGSGEVTLYGLSE